MILVSFHQAVRHFAPAALQEHFKTNPDNQSAQIVKKVLSRLEGLQFARHVSSRPRPTMTSLVARCAKQADLRSNISMEVEMLSSDAHFVRQAGLAISLDLRILACSAVNQVFSALKVKPYARRARLENML